MYWTLLVAGLIALAFALRWGVSALWVAFISDRWNEFDGDDRDDER